MIANTQRPPSVQRDVKVARPSSRHAHQTRTKFANAPHQPRTIDVALLGCGVVGSEVARYLVEQRELLAKRTGIDVRLKCILVRDRNRQRGINHRLFTDQFEHVLQSKPDVVIETLGGLDTACRYVDTLLSSGIDVITANKTLVAHRGAELHAVAARHSARLAYEAAVCSAIPVLTAIDRLRCDRVCSITGIVNGTCNFILTRMTEDGLELKQALEEAQSLGFAETDPTADLSGRDSAEKLGILLSASGLAHLQPHDIFIHGIQHITQRDIQAAKRLGCVIKLVAQATVNNVGVCAFVCPVLLPRRHPLADVRLQNNAVIIDSENGGPLFLQGRGAGPRPTVAAIVGDLIQLPLLKGAANLNIHSQDEHQIARAIEARCIVRLNPDAAFSKPDVLLKVLRDYGVAIQEIECSNSEVRFHSEENAISQLDSAVNALTRARENAAFIAVDGRAHSTFATLDGSCDANRERSLI